MPARICFAALVSLGLAACAGAPAQPEPDVAMAVPTSSGAQAPAVNPMQVFSWDEGIQKGDAAWKAGELDRALMFYVQAAGIDKTKELPLLRMASIHEQRKETGLAYQAFEEALKRAPNNAAARERFGFLLMRAGEVDRAGEQFTMALKVDPERARSMMGMGLVEQRRRNLEAARTHFDAALAKRPKDAELLTYSAELWLQSGGIEQGLRDVRSSLAISEVSTTRMLLGDLLARSGDFAGALEAYLTSLDEPRAYLRMGEEAMRAADYDRAIRYYKEALDASPTYNELAAKRLAVARERLAQASSARALPPPARPVSSAPAWQARIQ